MFYLSPVARNLLIANVVIFFLLSFLKNQYIFDLFAFYNPILPGSPDLINPNFKLWQPFSYMFLHGSFSHLLGNMLGLLFFAPAIETFFGSKRFLIYYLVTGIGASFIYTLANVYGMMQYLPETGEYLQLAMGSMVGASGAIFAILVAYAYLFPNNELIIFPLPIPIKAKYFVLLYGGYQIYGSLYDTGSNVAYFAHIGGLIIGFILLRFFGFGKPQY
ncbi:rhomboid family intramembrane serine protease [Emticicia fontis]